MQVTRPVRPEVRFDLSGKITRVPDRGCSGAGVGRGRLGARVPSPGRRVALAAWIGAVGRGLPAGSAREQRKEDGPVKEQGRGQRKSMIAGRAGPLGVIVGLIAVGVALGVGFDRSGTRSGVADAQGPSGPTHSSPIAITTDDQFVWSVNPDNDSVSVFNVANDAEPEGGGDPGRQGAVVRRHHAGRREGLRHQHGERHGVGDQRRDAEGRSRRSASAPSRSAAR